MPRNAKRGEILILSSKELAEIVEAVLKTLQNQGLTEKQEIEVKEIVRKVVVDMDGEDFFDHTHGKNGEME